MRRATGADVPVLVELTQEFYAEAGYPLDRAEAAGVFSALLADERLGQIRSSSSSTPARRLVMWS